MTESATFGNQGEGPVDFDSPDCKCRVDCLDSCYARGCRGEAREVGLLWAKTDCPRHAEYVEAWTPEELLTIAAQSGLDVTRG